MSIALALSGGAARGWAHIGVLRVLEEAGIVIGAVAGTSMGALVGLCHASGRLDALEQIARGATRRRMLSYLDPDLARGAWLGGRRIAQELTAHFDAMALEGLPIPISLVTADLDTAREVRLTSGPVIDAVQASMALPGFFRPVVRDGRTLIDGGMVANLPIAAARALAPGLPVIAVDVMADYRGHVRADPDIGRRSVLGMARSALLMMVAQQTRLTLALDPPAVLVAIPAGHISTGAFTRSEELITLGRQATITALPAIRAAIAA